MQILIRIVLEKIADSVVVVLSFYRDFIQGSYLLINKIDPLVREKRVSGSARRWLISDRQVLVELLLSFSPALRRLCCHQYAGASLLRTKNALNVKVTMFAHLDRFRVEAGALLLWLQ